MADKALYELSRKFYDNNKLHEVGDRLYFTKGEQPKGAVEVDEEAEAKAQAEAEKAAKTVKSK